MSNKQQVAVVGAGVAGLATAKVLLSQGHHVTVFEQGDALGGVWSPVRRYPGLKLQTKRQCYAFSDFPMPDHYPEFPSGEQVYDYLVAYARNFGVLDRIRFGSEVTDMVPRPDLPGWRLRVRTQDHAPAEHDFDFVVICNGVFATPNVPQFPGAAEFRANGGIILHSSTVQGNQALEGRDVVVIGFGKSALDIAQAALDRARSSAIVCRRVPWKVPHRIWGRLNIKHVILSRFTEVWFPHPRMRGARRILHRWFKPLIKGYWWMAEQVIGRQLGMRSPELRPDAPLAQAGPCVTLTWDNLAPIRDGRIGFHRGAIERFTPTGVALTDGRTVRAQTIVLATGFRITFPFLAERERKLLFDAEGRMLLYRFLINPDIPNMAFNGYNGVGVCQLAAEVGAAWLARLIEGRLTLPAREAMHASIREEIAWRQQLLSPPHGVGHYVTPYTLGYLDEVLNDLGLPPADRHKPLLRWLFDWIDPSDYRELLGKADKVAQ